MNIYAVTVTVEFTVLASSRTQARKFAHQSIEEGCVTIHDGEITVEKVQIAPAHSDGLATGGVISKEVAQEIGRSISHAGCVIQPSSHPALNDDGSGCAP